MNSKFTVEALKSVVFGDESSPRGLAKRALIQQGRVVCPTFPGVSPHYRFTWEYIQECMKTDKERMVDLMKSARIGAESAEAFRRTPSTSPLEVLAKSVNGVMGPQMMSSIPGLPSWDPNNGFDMDLFLKVDTGLGRSRFVMDLFPRFDGKYVDAFTSFIQEVEVVCLTGEDSEVEVIGTLILLDRLGKDGNTPERRSGVLQEFVENTGLWAISSPDVISLFLNRGALSLCEDGRDSFPTMATGAVVYGQGDKKNHPSEAFFTVGHARHVR